MATHILHGPQFLRPIKHRIQHQAAVAYEYICFYAETAAKAQSDTAAGSGTTITYPSHHDVIGATTFYNWGITVRFQDPDVLGKFMCFYTKQFQAAKWAVKATGNQVEFRAMEESLDQV
jgi:hypothetical protein